MSLGLGGELWVVGNGTRSGRDYIFNTTSCLASTVVGYNRRGQDVLWVRDRGCTDLVTSESDKFLASTPKFEIHAESFLSTLIPSDNDFVTRLADKILRPLRGREERGGFV